MSHGRNRPNAPPERLDTARTKNPPRSGHPSFPSFESFFTERAIIDCLCAWRIGRARLRNDRLFLHRIKAHHDEPPRKAHDVLFPPRRMWHRYRPRSRGERAGPELNRKALCRAILAQWKQEHPMPWAIELRQFVSNIRRRVLEDDGFRFVEPRIHSERKAAGCNEFRPIAVFCLEDRIIENQLARYLRACLDRVFDDASYAFRVGKNGNPAPTHHDAVREILRIRAQHDSERLYVAECDIRGFFDCVDHAQARKAFAEAVSEASNSAGGERIDPRALGMFDAFLDCYTFPRVVLGKAMPELAAKEPGALFKWAELELCEFHQNPRTAEVGIPQGGSVSALIANCLLHRADLRMRDMGKGKDMVYLRFCDDMILLSPSKALCVRAFSAYGETMRELHLPIHGPMWAERPLKIILRDIKRHLRRIDWFRQPLRESLKQWKRQLGKPDWSGRYGKWFWAGKSRPVYRWASALLWFKRSPWIQFVGYQVRHDGAIRIRKSSIDRHARKIRKTVKDLISHIHRAQAADGRPTAAVRKSLFQIRHRLRMRLISMAVGRRRLAQVIRGPLAKCWCGGFECLNHRPLWAAQLKALDRNRERQLRRARRALEGHCPDIQRNPMERIAKALPFYGRPYSYFGQFLPDTDSSRPPRA